MNVTGSGAKEEGKLSATAERLCRRFSLTEIQLATKDFSEAHLIGIGGFGKVYKGHIDDGKETVAMKRLAPNSNQGEGEFLTEIETLSKLRHINLVSLIGYCNENAEMILVYEYIPRGTLADHLYKLSRSSESISLSSLTWKQRLKICIGAGRGIDYLHTGSSIIHRDVKSTNILLDENFTAKVSDFGLAKHFTSNSKSHVSTIVKGTFGYLDPSYFITCRLTQKSDTFAFGVVLLEVLCGRPPVDQTLGEDDMSLVMWAREKTSKGKADQIVASNLRDKISADCLKKFVGIAMRCLNHEPKKRPTMAQVVVQLESALERQQDERALPLNASRFLPFWNRIKPFGTGSIQQEQKQGDVNTLPTAITVTQEEALEDEQTFNMLPVAVPAIPIHELQDITNNFSSDCLIDKRPGGIVYRGTLKSGQDAAIKKLHYSILPDEEFLEKVSLVSSLNHENLAPLLGYCVDDSWKFLVYEFAQNGSLHDILHGQGVNSSKPVPALSWGQRVKIAMGAAKGLEYIHKKTLIHYNFKSSNILVFDDYQVAKLVDFDRPTQSSREVISWRHDVYSFGVLLVELLTGRKVIDHTRPRGQQYLVQWAMPKLNKHEVKEIVDARLNGNYPPKAIEKVVKVAVACLQLEAEFRPDMSMVVRDLYPL